MLTKQRLISDINWLVRDGRVEGDFEVLFRGETTNWETRDTHHTVSEFLVQPLPGLMTKADYVAFNTNAKTITLVQAHPNDFPPSR